MRHFPLLFLFYITSLDCSLLSRAKRQTSVGSNAATNGNGDSVLTDASTQHFKTSDGNVAMNVTSNGNATGAGSSNIDTSAGGNVGNTNVDNVANVMSIGDSAKSYSDIFAAVEGEKITSNVMQQGKVIGQGATLSNVNGGSSMQNRNGERKNGFSFGNAGGTGSINTETEVQTQQAMSWDQLMARLMASASASGAGSAQSNVDLGTGSGDNNITISGLVSGLNSNQGTVNTLVKGNGIINGTDQNVVGTMYGISSGKGNSTLVGASSIVSNQSSSLGEIQAFGNSNAYSSGNTSVNLMSNTNIESDSGLGVVHIDGKGQGTDNYIVASNGLKFVNSNNDAAFMGSGNVRGSGSDENSKASQSVDTAVDPSGVVKIIAQSDGQSISHDGKNASLTFNDNGLVGGWRNSSFSGFANGVGSASGKDTNVTGQGFVLMDGASTNGNSSMQAFGTGTGQISADTKAVLNVVENGVQRNGTVNGIAAADGNNTHVQSLSLISNLDGFETVNNYQKVSSSGAGSSSVSASSSTIFKRKKRFAVLSNMLKQ